MTERRARPSPHRQGPALALMVTRRCNMTCAHCSVASGPDVRGEPSAEELMAVVHQAARSGVRAINITGGEPMLRRALVERLVRAGHGSGMATAVTTNGFWGRTPVSARKHLRALRRAGLNGLTVSYDRYHAAFQGHDPVINIARAAGELRFPVNVNVVRTANDGDLVALTERLEQFPHVHLRFYDVQPVGRASRFPADSLRDEVAGFCGAAAFPAVTDDGRVVACNGPSYFAPAGSPLIVGSLRDGDLATWLERHRADPILDTIRTLGPARLRDELRQIPGFEGFPFRPRYRGLCDLCHHITSDPAAVAALRTRLAAPVHTALRQATWRIIEESRHTGVLSRRYVNGEGAGRTILSAVTTGRWPRDTASILGRADIDWARLGGYLAACGLARPLVGALGAPELARWAPAFFIARLRAHALQDALRESAQKEAVHQIGAVLSRRGARGVLLKGTGLAHRSPRDAGGAIPRASTDLDIYVDPRLAGQVRRDLLEAGFAGDRDAAPAAAHHLAPVTFQGGLVELHTRLVAPFWGLPEREILARAEPVRAIAPFDMLGPEGQILHTAIHTAQDSFSHGLKAAWDLLWVQRSAETIDWDRLAGWVGASRVPRAFWASVAVLVRELQLPVPASFLGRAPTDRHQRRLETVAHRRLFRVAERPEDLDALSRQGLRLLMHDSWPGFLRYLLSQAAVRTSGKEIWRGTAQRATRRGSLRAALDRWRQYRRAICENDLDGTLADG